MYIFVYGTLKKGYGLNRMLKDSKYIGPATIKGTMCMADNASFPYVAVADEDIFGYGTSSLIKDTKVLELFKDRRYVPAASTNTVHGEVYDVVSLSILKLLDAVEGYRYSKDRLMSHYNRVLVISSIGPCFMYAIESCEDLEHVKSGKFEKDLPLSMTTPPKELKAGNRVNVWSWRDNAIRVIKATARFINRVSNPDQKWTVKASGKPYGDVYWNTVKYRWELR